MILHFGIALTHYDQRVDIKRIELNRLTDVIKDGQRLRSYDYDSFVLKIHSKLSTKQLECRFVDSF